jgi:hypothetical protein
MPKCSITCSEITNIPEASPAIVQRKQRSTHLSALLPP